MSRDSKPESLIHLSARDMARAVRAGQLTSEDLVTAHLARIAEREPSVGAWRFLDGARALSRAREADSLLASGTAVGVLHGIPIGIKDVFDTSDMPSEYGSHLYQGRRPERDAAAVRVLRRAGAIIMGKTVTSEFGMYHPSVTRNPLDPARSPGVSSSGSAAAVADHMVPLALGTQHTASTLLPASFCGAFAFKPSFGFTDMSGSNVLAARLAHVGFFARSVGDLAFFASAFDPPLRESECLTAIPRLALAHGPGWHHAEADSVQRLAGLIESLPVQVHAVRWNIEFAAALPLCVELLNVNLALRFKSQPQEMLCEPLRAAVASGLAITLARYEELNAEADRLAQVADSVLEKYDALLSLSAPGEATRLEEGPGSGALCMAWSLCGLPTVSLPLLTGRNGLPIGVQLIGRRGQDRHLLSVASWLTRVAMGKELGSQNV